MQVPKKRWVSKILEQHDHINVKTMISKVHSVRKQCSSTISIMIPFVVILFMLFLLITTFFGDVHNDHIIHSHDREVLASTCWSKKADPTGMVVFDIIGIIYMFIALSIGVFFCLS